MRVNIDIDMSQIDYDAITQEVIKKVQEQDFEKMYDIENRVEHQIQHQINNAVFNATQKYVEKSWGYNYNSEREELSYNARTTLDNLVRTKVEESIQPIIEEMLTHITPKKIQEMIVDIFPSIFVSVLTNFCRDGFYSSTNYAVVTANADARTAIKDAFRQIGVDVEV